VLLNPCETLRLTGQEHGRAIPLADHDEAELFRSRDMRLSLM